jgi:hypothetical protein
MTGLLLPLHGIGGRQDLPIPFGLAVGGAAVAIAQTVLPVLVRSRFARQAGPLTGAFSMALSFVVLGLAWRSPKYRGNASGKPLPAAITRTVDAVWFRWAVRLAGLAIFLYAMVSLLFGVDRLTNPIFGFVYILVWVGLVPISILLGPVWRTLNPLRTIHLLLSKVLRQPPSKGVLELPAWVGLWPAALGVFAFTWLELVAPDRATIPVLQAWLALYFVITLFGAILFGDRWFSTGDPFEAYAILMSRLSPWGRRTDGALVVRRPVSSAWWPRCWAPRRTTASRTRRRGSAGPRTRTSR